jgi:hypothetical protein
MGNKYADAFAQIELEQQKFVAARMAELEKRNAIFRERAKMYAEKYLKLFLEQHQITFIEERENCSESLIVDIMNIELKPAGLCAICHSSDYNYESYCGIEIKKLRTN